MLWQDKYVDRQRHDLRVGKGRLIVERVVEVNGNGVEQSMREKAIVVRGFSIADLAYAAAIALDGFVAAVPVVSGLTAEGNWRPVLGPYSLMQLWGPANILLSQLWAVVHRTKFIKYSRTAPDARLSISYSPWPRGRAELPGEPIRYIEENIKALGLRRVTPDEFNKLMRSGLVKPGGDVPLTPLDHLMSGLVLAVQTCPMKDGEVRQRELERLSAQARALRELFVGPDDQVTQTRAAEIAECDERTIRRWIDGKKLPAYGPERRVSESELREFLPRLVQRRPRVRSPKQPD